MRVAKSIQEAANFAPSALTIGNFDGVHIGHQYLFRQAIDLARELNCAPTVLTFDPHPARIVAPERAPLLIITPEERIARMGECGIEQVLLLPFTQEIACLSPEAFVAEIVVRALKARAVLVGDNFRFGHKQSGDTDTLLKLGERMGFETCIVGAIKSRGRVVSSSAVRERIDSGDVSRACRFLNRPYALSGEVVHGHGIGSKQTVPTLNLKTSAEILPRPGVYITRTRDLEANRAWNSVTNIGYRPTFGGEGALSIETFLLQPLDGETPARIRVEFLKRLREERKFDNPEALKAQILRDAGRSRTYFRRRAGG